MAPRIRTYAEMIRSREFEERFNYLRLNSSVGVATFGFDRYLNQRFYTSPEWRSIRNQVIARDRGCDLGVEGREIYDRPLVHHMNPMTVDDVMSGESHILDPEFLVTVSHRTHNAIHYGDATLLEKPFKPRRPGDTKLW